MDDSTDDVTLYSAFVFTVVDQCRGMEKVCAPLFDMVRPLDRGTPKRAVPITLYNEICGWIEQNLGAASVRSAGAAIGRAAFERMLQTGEVSPNVGPIEALRSLARTVNNTVHDPKRRGWELLDPSDGRVIARRTQTFNCVMQEGVLMSVLEGSGALMPRVDHFHCTRRGDEFCQYELRWLPKRSSGRERIATKTGDF